MILLISPLAKTQNCIRAIQEGITEPVRLCARFEDATSLLQEHEVSAVVFDQLLLDAEPDGAEAVLKHLGTAVPVYVNFAVSGARRLIRELRFALQRREREKLAAKQEAELALRHELSNAITALLLSCEMALQAPGLPALAESKMHTVEALAREMSAKLGALA